MSTFTLDLDYEKQVELLLADENEEEDKELNYAKINYETINNSNWSATSFLMLNNLFGAIPDISNKNNIQINENEDHTSTNTNVTSNTQLLNAPSSPSIHKNINNTIKGLSISSINNDKIFENFSSNSNNNVNQTATNINNRTDIIGSYGNFQNMNKTFFNNYNMNDLNLTYDFYPNNFKKNYIQNHLPVNINNCNNGQLKLNNNNNSNKFNNNNNYYLNSNSINTINEKNPIKSSNTFNSNKNQNIINNNINYNCNINYNNNINFNTNINFNNNNYYNNGNNNQNKKNKKTKSYFYNKDNNNQNSNPLNNNNNLNCLNKYQNNSSNKIKTKPDNLLYMIKDQIGNKRIQKKIEEKSPKFLYELYQQIKKNLYEIINDQYGNYAIQKFVKYCDKKVLSIILKTLYEKNCRSIYEISMNPHGTRVIQKLIENISQNANEEDCLIIKKSLEGNISSMIKDINGNHVIQCIIENVKNDDLLFVIYKEINEKLFENLNNKSGSCVFSKIIKCDIASEGVINMIDNILQNLNLFINNEYGNFAVQKIIEINDLEYNTKIYEYIKDKFVNLSCQKYASNVIECCLLVDMNLKQKLISKLFERNNIMELVVDKYGNYIVQKILELMNKTENEFLTLIEIIRKNSKIAKSTEYGKKFYEKFNKNYKNYFENNNKVSGNKKEEICTISDKNN